MKKKGIIVTGFITVIVIICILAYYLSIALVVGNLWISILLGIIALAVVGVAIYVCKKRIEEIKGGETDDLSKY